MDEAEARLLVVHRALIEGAAQDLAAACDPGVPDGVALVILPHGSAMAQIAFGTRAEVVRELSFVAEEEGPAVVDLEGAASALMRAPRPGGGALLCVVVAAGRARLHEIPWPAEPGVWESPPS
jgi:hypothetical protein